MAERPFGNGFELLERRALLTMVFADAVIEYTPGDGVAEEHRNPTAAIGPDSADGGAAVSLGESGRLAVLFAQHVVVDGPGWDIRVDEIGSGDWGVYWLSDDGGGTWHHAGAWDGDALIDIGDTDLEVVNAVLIVDDPPSGGSSGTPGVDVGSVSARYVAEDFLPGDANEDRRFDTEDIGLVALANKYGTGEDATWGEGDWNGDGVFSQLDLVAALQTGNYLMGIYSAS